MDENPTWKTRLDASLIERYEREGLWSGVTLARCAAQRAAEAPDLVAAVDRTGAVGFATLHAQAQWLAAALAERGLRPGDVVSFQLPNWHEAMVINLAACLGGYVCNPIIPIYRDAEVGYILRHAHTRVFFIPRSFRSIDYLEMVRRLQPGLPALRDVVLVGDEGPAPDGCLRFQDLLRAVEPRPFPPVDPNAVKLLLFTSGTTGDPKGVLHSHNTIRAEMEAVMRFWSIRRSDVVLMPSPVTHITGYLYALELAFAAGVKVVLMEKWDAAQAWELIERHGATFTIAATPFLIELSAEVERRGIGLPSMRLFGSGGAPVPEAVVARARAALPACQVFRVYGSSEAPTVTLGVREGDPPSLGGTTDGAICNHEVRIVDPETGQPVATGAEGEIVTRGPEVMLGYTKPQYTQEAFDAEGFFHTGDLGFVDARGYITISGRKKDLIIRGGENISPKEIEDLLHQHAAVQEAAVVAMPHARLGETPCACVVLRPGAQLELAGLVAFLDAARLARQKFPERLLVLEELPRTASGKVLKHVLRKRLADEAAAGAAAA
ncbi:AMP-binding protein [Ramlibacter sp. AN1015]|uniref:AMP-binding protein n=1 Tax=Ramlibacter sp. AN1015 TaxID=3133428 RepID=UPI0030C149A9